VARDPLSKSTTQLSNIASVSRRYARFCLRPHPRIGGLGSVAPFQDGFDVEAVLAGEETGRRLRRFELGSNSRRRAGAAVKNACHSASSS